VACFDYGDLRVFRYWHYLSFDIGFGFLNLFPNVVAIFVDTFFIVTISAILVSPHIYDMYFCTFRLL
jgi:hypothetical protein